MRKIDVFTHIWPKPFHEALIAHLGHTTDITRRSEAVPMMTDLDRRFAKYCRLRLHLMKNMQIQPNLWNWRPLLRTVWRNSVTGIRIDFPDSSEPLSCQTQPRWLKMRVGISKTSVRWVCRYSPMSLGSHWTVQNLIPSLNI